MRPRWRSVQAPPRVEHHGGFGRQRESIDRELEQGIKRWRQAVEHDPGNFSAHQELARLAERRDQRKLALRHYLEAWKIRPGERSLLLDYARVAQGLGEGDDATAALLAASRGGSPRTAERAREQLPERYPYVYEFRKAVELDPANSALRREYAYLLLEMKKHREAEREFSRLIEQSPEDLMSTAQLGFLLLNREDYGAAMPLLQKVLDGTDRELAERVREALSLPEEQTRAEEPAPPPEGTAAVKSMAAKALNRWYR